MTVDPTASSVFAEIARLRQLHAAGRHADVLAAGSVLLGEVPENRDLLLLVATSQRVTGDIAAAIAMLDRLEALHPRFSRMLQERGLCFVAQKDAPRAIDALLRAVNINPALPMSWQMLAGVYRLSGDPANAAIAAEHVAALASLRPAVVAATSLFADGDLAPAEEIVRNVLRQHGDDVEAMRLLAKIGMAREVFDDAELLFDAVLARVPGHRAARHEYAQCLIQRHKYAAAQAEIATLLAADPGNTAYRALAATAAVGVGDNEGAIELYRALLADVPDSPDVHLWLGHALKTVSRVPEAIAAYRGAAAARPDFGDAYWSLANLKTYRFPDAEVDAMADAEAAPATQPDDRIHLAFALGKAHEDRGDYARSWDHYARGNELKRAESRYRPEIIEANTRQQIAVCTPAFFARRAGWGDPRPDPIFIVGLPRSGSTLIEQILASHSAVEGTQELADIQRIVLDLQGRDPDPDNPRYPAILAEMTDAEFTRWGDTYLADTRIHRTDRPFFIDKMPNNFRHIGLIHLMLPNARIIDARREPMACCFSNLKQLFANGQEFTYSDEHIARYYRTYLELMAHWDIALPGRILRVNHENVVADLEGSVHRILEHCGLPYESGCVEFYKTRRHVRTPSSEQVRQPIFRQSLDQWKNYAAELMPLRLALGNAIEG
ncbi:sulfotransferase [Polymorphobacter sp. PAMC 29334]|uniref:tetratricopeptide repeat-containing sulfotransferase family protein n=1 Tax=Polymorphobacter sp. PAMC 29334 TaxID=2862331 RepID=UPI001C7525AD|nr:tetratricopeptide repeat-containing sulfotransferase family protein [Polymorphobacter sp. PAMC 29334]QYE36718.1 sulfotransferase [Polymorphobacter sp. PAMC 29334]